MPLTEKELIEETIFRAKESAEKNVLSKDGKLPPDAAAYGELWPWIVYKFRSAASERRMLFGMKANNLCCWLNDDNEVVHSHLNYVDYGYPITYEDVELSKDLKNAFKNNTVTEGAKIIKEKMDPTNDKVTKYFVQVLYLSDFAKVGTIDQDKPLSEQRHYKPLDYPNDVDINTGILYDLWHAEPRRYDIYPLPPTMKGFLLMSRDRFVKWLRQVTWPTR
ncbi:MAG: hypothetical protein SYNGOMJ08_00300 [Candidatus Syntrophoarchaeum sp. GoM_oil]|nr:MAG: hypothetical protein SYNGOMJ08_00300 [Candidatus Syntrophoarchaeum sp. GoM_oil]